MDANPKFLNPRGDMQPSTTTTSSSDSAAEGGGEAKWAAKLLRECAAAMSQKDSGKMHHLLWMLNELASPYGDPDQKIAAYFLQALFCKATDSGRRCYKTLASVAERSHSFDSSRKLILKFQEVSPWTTFGHVASNGATLEAFEGEPNLHIIDVSTTLCTQWPTLLEALATRTDDTPRLRLTVVAATAAVKSAMKEITPRIEKFARLMGVPFELSVVADLSKDSLTVREGEAVAVNCVGALSPNLIETMKWVNPKVVTVVEEEADFSSNRDDFVECFEECLRFHTVYFDMLEESFAATSNEKLMLERECLRSIVRVLACDGDDKVEEHERERGRQWSERLREAGFSAVAHSEDVVDDVRALLKRYRAGWSLVAAAEDDQTGIFLAWKEEPVVWASVWKPSK
ncbi:protein SHORT-ROOT-like [Salvia hispanica]|uniref:protein SHORT-ROOT-like n=1 Tax=Salvia hispanica TaxID=49212 RepID=UPI002009026C|nr:protein SHORT-ROOT-like [Salvia hispanica]